MKRSLYPLITALLICMALLLFPDSAFAQEAAPESAPSGGGDTNFIDLLKQGGWAMWPLGLFSMASVGLMIYNGLMIRPKTFLGQDVTGSLAESMNALDIDGARKICVENPAPLTNIVHAGLSRIDEGHIEMAQVEKAIDDSTAAELSGPFVMINYLSVIGAVAPMVGLLGTVSGMVKAFRAISDVGMGDPSVLATNISEALVTTASGLIVAIPSLIAYFYFKAKYGKIAAQVGKIVGDLFFNMFSAIRKSA